MYFYTSLILAALIGLQSISCEEAMPLSSSEANEALKASEQPIDTSSPNSVPEMSATDETTETIAILFEEVNLKDHNLDELSTEKTTTELNELITSEFNGFDDKESESSFSCYGRSFGQYADVSKDCRVFHLCYPFFNASSDELLYQRISFLCDEESVFDQKRFICVDNATVEHKCSDSEALYLTSNQEYLIRVFSQSVSPIDEVKGRTETQEETQSSANVSNPGWFNWLYANN